MNLVEVRKKVINIEMLSALDFIEKNYFWLDFILNWFIIFRKAREFYLGQRNGPFLYKISNLKEIFTLFSKLN